LKLGLTRLEPDLDAHSSSGWNIGDNIPTAPTTPPNLDQWRTAFIQARLFVDAVNRHGGDAQLLHLPQIGIFGNTHFSFSDLNNRDVADELSRFLSEKSLDKRDLS
jgi:hypothetical protein